ncbi:hypothetical protein [[Acholeplasma] multilocale]|uniref:hypothetical protein n=1 Tax=[Acholeplasma] multilocale TaxID=264638 RepID=UPI00047D8B44|nr:hypothetical protein [[Acholeplasma] multilocale]
MANNTIKTNEELVKEIETLELKIKLANLENEYKSITSGEVQIQRNDKSRVVPLTNTNSSAIKIALWSLQGVSLGMLVLMIIFSIIGAIDTSDFIDYYWYSDYYYEYFDELALTSTIFSSFTAGFGFFTLIMNIVFLGMKCNVKKLGLATAIMQIIIFVFSVIAFSTFLSVATLIAFVFGIVLLGLAITTLILLSKKPRV